MFNLIQRTGILFSKRTLPKCVSVAPPCMGSHRSYCLKGNYSEEDKDKILTILNSTKNVNDLSKFSISKSNIAQVLKLKDESGTFVSIHELLPALDAKAVDRFFRSVLGRSSAKIAHSMFPVLDPEQVIKCSRVLSITISGGNVSFCCISRKMGSLTVDFLDVVQFPFKPRMHFLSVLNEIHGIARNAPECDLCIVEEFRVGANTSSAYLFNFQLQMTQARSMFLGYMMAKQNPPLIISIKAVAVSRLFNTYIGFERVSCQLITENIMERSPTLFTEELRNFVIAADPKTKKEHLSNVFLLNLAYWKLTKQFQYN